MVKRATEDDAAIGRKLRALRLKAGMSQISLAGELEVTFQQIQKYEKGTNRISGARLMHLGRIFEVSLDDLCGVERIPERTDVDDATQKLGTTRRGIELARIFDVLDSE